MKTLRYIGLIFFSVLAFLIAKEKESITYLSIKEVAQTSSSPKELKPFSKKQLGEYLKNWKHVEKKEFYYESIEGVTFPWQEGTITFQDETTAKWRFYHCGGLRIEVSAGETRYLLPRTEKQKDGESDS